MGDEDKQFSDDMVYKETVEKIVDLSSYLIEAVLEHKDSMVNGVREFVIDSEGVLLVYKGILDRVCECVDNERDRLNVLRFCKDSLNQLIGYIDESVGGSEGGKCH